MVNGDVQKHCDCPIGRTQTANDLSANAGWTIRAAKPCDEKA
jgi:hypothetical protein